MVLALACLLAAPHASAGVTAGGDTSLAASPDEDSFVGVDTVGTLCVDGGSTLSNRHAHVGYNADSTGEVTVTGPLSTWDNRITLNVGFWGSGTLRIDGGGQVLSQYANLGYHLGSTGEATVAGPGSSWTVGDDLYVGESGDGTLHVETGAHVTSKGAYLGLNEGCSGAATVSGPGSSWTMDNDLYLGFSGDGSLRIEAGGQVAAGTGYVGYYPGGVCTATVAGTGSSLSFDGHLYVGDWGPGTLAVSDGGRVRAKLLEIRRAESDVRLHVSGDDMIVLGDAATVGSLANDGEILLYADAFRAAGVCTPIADCEDRPLGWSGTGSSRAWGGIWDSGAKTLTVPAATALTAGVANSVDPGERLMVTDAASAKRVGASFSSAPAGTTFRAEPLAQSDLDLLAATPGFDGEVLSGWDFRANCTGGEILLSFELGSGCEDLGLWHFDAGAWSPFEPAWQTCDAGGVLSFPVDALGGYAVSGVPAELSADANGDGVVDAADYIILKRHMGTSTGAVLADGDFDLDGDVDWDDLQTLIGAMSGVGGTQGPTIPEPASLCLLALGGLAILHHRRS